VDFAEHGEVRLHRPDGGFVGDFDDRGVVATFGQPHRRVGQPERAHQLRLAGLGQLRGGQVELEQLAAAADDEDAGTGREAHRLAGDQDMA
jgi:hypothetical protein